MALSPQLACWRLTRGPRQPPRLINSLAATSLMHCGGFGLTAMRSPVPVAAGPCTPGVAAAAWATLPSGHRRACAGSASLVTAGACASSATRGPAAATASSTTVGRARATPTRLAPTAPLSPLQCRPANLPPQAQPVSRPRKLAAARSGSPSSTWAALALPVRAFAETSARSPFSALARAASTRRNRRPPQFPAAPV